jgi:endonuclease YncB( thermonuclease family)
VINNLISNAIKFTPVGGRIEISARPVDDTGKKMVAIAVEDTGPGISKEDQTRIFNRFVQLKSSAKQEVKGTGLGLSICNAFVDLHKGRLWLESPAPGKKSGSVFGFTLPAVQRSAATKVAAPVEEKKAPPKKGSFWKRIFLRGHVFLFALFLAAFAQARPYWGTVRRVMAPGVYQFQDGTIIKTLGIDAPAKGSAAYEDAFAANRQTVEKKEIRLKYGTQERDSTGAWLAYVYVDGIFVNEQLVRDGLALVSPLPNKEDVLPDLLRAELLARREQRGLWRDASIPAYGERAKQKSGLPF